VMDPKPALRDKVSVDVFIENFENEAAILSTVTHHNVIKLLDYGIIKFDSSQIPYVVTEFIEGETLDHYAQESDITDEILMSVLGQTLAGLQFLHGRTVILDLGLGKVFGDGDRSNEDDLTYLLGTERFLPPEVRPILAANSGNRIQRKVLYERYFPHIDLFAFGVTMADVQGLLAPRQTSVGPRTLDILKDVSQMLTDPANSRYRTLTAKDLRRMLRQLDPSSLAPLGVPELAAIPNGTNFTTTTQGRVALTGRVERIRWHPMLWRLHELPQLELAYFVYAGARHSRYLHALNTYNAMRQLMNGLLADERARKLCTRTDIEATVFRALLHDVAHYPLSQIFEDIAAVKDHGIRYQISDNIPPSRLELFSALVSKNKPDGRAGEIFDIVAEVRDSNGRTFPELLEEELTADVVERMQYIGGEGPYSDESAALLSALLTSPIDACKLAYLVDDSIMTGLSFGLSIDVPSIASALRCPSERDYDQETAFIGISERGVPAAAAAVEARQHMLVKAYWHAANRSIMAMFKHVVLSLMTANKFSFVEYFKETLFKDEREATYWLSKRFNEAFGDTQVNPLECLLPTSASGLRGEYRRLIEITVGVRGSARLYNKLRGSNPFEYDSLYRKLSEALVDLADPGPRPGEILLDVPFKDRENLGGRVLVYPSGNAGAGNAADNGDNLLDVVPTLGNLRGDRFDHSTKVVRVLIHPTLMDRLTDVDAAAEQVLEQLREI
jgi:HD superfamily phosphohydrolase